MLSLRSEGLRLLGAALAAFLLLGGCSPDRPLSPVDPLDASDPDPVTVIDPAPLPAAGDTVSFVEPYDSNRNEGGWSWYTPQDPVFEETGGNLDGWLHDDNVVSFAPHPGTALGVISTFTGSYRDRQVISLGIDLRSVDYDWDVSGRYLALMIMNDAGTPLDVSDDWGAFIIGPDKVPSKYLEMKSAADKNAPGWRSYDFAIEATAAGLPAGWTMVHPEAGGAEKAGATWRALMSDVSYVQFWYGDPLAIYLLNEFDLGLDNPRISWVEVD